MCYYTHAGYWRNVVIMLQWASECGRSYMTDFVLLIYPKPTELLRIQDATFFPHISPNWKLGYVLNSMYCFSFSGSLRKHNFTRRTSGLSIPLQAWTNPQGSRNLKLQNFYTIGTLRWQSCQSYAPAVFTPGEISATSFCHRLTAIGRIKSIKYLKDPIGNRTWDLPACSSIPQSTMPPRSPFL